MTAPTATTTSVTPSGRPASTTNDAATGSSRLMPRLDHSEKVPRSPRTGVAVPTSVVAGSCEEVTDVVVLMVSPYAGMTRTGSSGRRRQPSSQPGRPGLPHT